MTRHRMQSIFWMLSRISRDFLLVGSMIFLLSGCRAPEKRINLQTSLPTESLPDYRILFPDVVEISIDGHPEWSGSFSLTPEGRIDLPALGSPRIEGASLEELQEQLSQVTGLPQSSIHCRIAEFRGQMLYIYGPVKGPPRAVSYRGAEDVVSLLQRVGGLDYGAAIRHIYVVRSNLQFDENPEIFEVDLNAILDKGDNSSNVTLQPLDAIYVAETRRWSLAKLLPDWLRLPARRNSD